MERERENFPVSLFTVSFQSERVTIEQRRRVDSTISTKTTNWPCCGRRYHGGSRSLSAAGLIRSVQSVHVLDAGADLAPCGVRAALAGWNQLCPGRSHRGVISGRHCSICAPENTHTSAHLTHYRGIHQQFHS